MDLIIRETRPPEGDGFRDIGIADGRIRRIAPRIAETAASEIAAGGRLVIPGLVESHFHVDKALLGAGAPHWAGTVQGVIHATAEAKRAFTVEDIAARAHRALEMAIRHDTTAMRTHVEVDPTPPETEALMREALAMGVDFHLDTFDEARGLSIGHVAALTVKQGWQGRAGDGHMTAVGALDPAELAPIAAMIRATPASPSSRCRRRTST